MKRKVGIGMLLWALLISLGHIQLNLGWSALRKEVAILTGQQREELVIGFLPVT
ncbi:MAG: hypothetical protein QGI93_14580 [Planctomycetota bacterium]|jgi:hypothetical protein|nr:hypothetical protein [Planctomycetota bacterium]MDP6937409.1 hypothetical protein [Planctomycetota bacterium]HJM55774.1 hypothetical protein [Planctomycetota bacterium]